jgi:hypothetical protein
MLTRLASVGEAVSKSEAELFHAKLERDREIKRASELGVSRRAVASAVGLTPAVIKQILKRS